MKSIAIPLTLLLSACSGTASAPQPAQLNYVDLSSETDPSQIERYWDVAKTVEPEYPVSAARDGISGCVDLIVGINSDGKLQGFKIRSSYPKGVFDKSAATAIAKWRWSAAEANPERKPILTSYQLDFRLFNVNEISSKNKSAKADFLTHCDKHNT